MSLRMPSATKRHDSSFYEIQKRVPPDVLARAAGRVYPITLPAVGSAEEEVIEVTIGKVLHYSVRVRDPEAAKLRTAAFYAQLGRIFESLRREPRELTRKDVVALAGEVYHLVVDRFERDPGEAGAWEAWKAFTWAALEGRVPNPPTISWQHIMDERQAARGEFGVATGPVLLDIIEELPRGDSERSLEVRFGLLATWVLSKHGLEVTAKSRAALLREVAEAAFDVGFRLKRAAQGDYSPDPRESRFPRFEVVSDTGLTFEKLFTRWSSETKPESSTMTTWRAAVRHLSAHLQHDTVEALTKKDVIEWKDKLVGQQLAPGTINGSYLACLNAILSYGIRNQVVRENVAAGIKVAHKRRPGDGQLPYEDREVVQLLALASKETNAARRWIPLLAACSGARAGELAQLWAERVRNIDGVLAMELRPAEDGGSLKNVGSERTVPLHPALIEAGFIDFVHAKGRGPLFYGRASGGERHASKGTVNHLAGWIRKQPGFDNPRKAPSHAFRHWWKTTASRVGISDSRADFIQGHKTQGEAAGYRHFDLPSLAEDVAKIPVPLPRD